MPTSDLARLLLVKEPDDLRRLPSAAGTTLGGDFHKPSASGGGAAEQSITVGRVLGKALVRRSTAAPFSASLRHDAAATTLPVPADAERPCEPRGFVGYVYFRFGTDSTVGEGARVPPRHSLQARPPSRFPMHLDEHAQAATAQRRTVRNHRNRETISVRPPFSTPATPVTTAAVTSLTVPARRCGTVNPEGSELGFCHWHDSPRCDPVTACATVSAGAPGRSPDPDDLHGSTV